MYKLENLLVEATLIRKHYQEIARFTGENFNLFKILNLTTNEVRTHSAILAEFLNPRGSHGQGAMYLNLFINHLSRIISNNILLSNFYCFDAKVFVEYHIGPINEDKSEGGYIDILIWDKKGQKIIIENKIYASDQENQLIRYFAYAKNKNNLLLYLTLDGHAPSATSINNDKHSLKKNENFYCISYEEMILSWLEDCHQASSSLPIVRESIQQYIYLIRNLTGKSNIKAMGNEIVNLLGKNAENISAAFDISNNIEGLKKFLIYKLKEQLERIGKELNLETENDNFEGKEERYFSFKFPKSKFGTSISFGFEKNYEGFSIGIYTVCEAKIFNESKKIISKELGGYLKDENYSNWLFLHYFTKNEFDFDSQELWLSIANNELSEKLKDILTEILNILKHIKNIEL
ncbi:MAG: PD-(D/E)XK nuclease family protein [Bacteroidales bacterium]|nr:PD-(D/E)XK nuclease family protein [Bacteroidales bacterium]